MRKIFIVIALLLSLTITSTSAREVTDEAKITGLYVAYFDRAADQEGLGYWTNTAYNVAREGGDTSEVFITLSSGFATHPTFTATYAHLNNEEFVAVIYRNALGRDGDTQGIGYWRDLLDRGMSRYEMVATFVELSLVTDLTKENYPRLSDEELEAAQLRQDLITNKVTVALAFTNQLGVLSNVVDSQNPEKDHAYLASIVIISKATEDTATVTPILAFLDSIMYNADPIGDILEAAGIVNPGAPPPSYTTLTDLEFKTLNFSEFWHVVWKTTYSSMIFSNHYISYDDGRPMLVDNLSDSVTTSGCVIAPVELGRTYMCLSMLSHGAQAAYAIDIDSTGHITGNFEYSPTGDTYELMEGIADWNLADAWVTGTVSSSVAGVTGTVSSTVATAQTKVINTEIDNQAKYSEFDSIIPQPLKKQSNNNSEIAQKLDEMFNQLMLKNEL